jgi:tRNA(Ile)-lysidine synthase
VSEFLQRAESEIQNRRLLARGRKILVAVSGGADSMVLLRVLTALAQKNRWQICVAHFNHQLRGRASAADEKMVRKTAADLALPVFVGRADVKTFAAKSKFSIEMAARKLRHEFFARTAKAQKVSVVALAHHADDQVELFFLRVLRGAGGEGLAGMKWRSPSPADKKLTLVRPLLGLTKTELLGFARENKIRFHDDGSNASSDFLRNRIRNELLPLLQKKYQPGLAKTVLRLMEITGAEAEFTGDAARQWFRSSGRESAQNKKQSRLTSAATIEEENFIRLPVAVQRRVLQRQLTELGVGVDFELVERLRETPAKTVSVGPGLSVAREAAGKIRLREQIENQFKTDELKLSGRAGQAEFAGLEINWTIKKFNGMPGRSPHQAEFFDADKIGDEITLRHWRAGDRFQPIGLPSPVKLQDLFVNAKIPRERRRELVVAATAAGELFWVESLRISEPFKLTLATRRRLVWAWRAV